MPWGSDAFDQGLEQGPDAPYPFTLPPRGARIVLNDLAGRLQWGFSTSTVGSSTVYENFAQQLIDCHHLQHEQPDIFFDLNDPGAVKDFSQTYLPAIYGVARNGRNDGYIVALNYFNVTHLPVDALIAM